MADSLTLAAGAQAFGDTTHPSTRLMLEALEALAPNLAGEAAPHAVCDMGAGSGILALRAAQLWPDACVVAAELDRAAVAVIAENAKVNEIGVIFSGGRLAAPAPPLTSWSGPWPSSRSMEDNVAGVLPLHSDGFRHPQIHAEAPYGLIFMNILPEVILRLMQDAEALLEEGGLLMLSGILEHRQEHIIEAAQGLGLELSYRLRLEGWVALVFQKPRIS